VDKSLECCLFNVSASGTYKSGYYACVTTTACNEYADSIAKEIGKDIAKGEAKGESEKDISNDVKNDIAKHFQGRATSSKSSTTDAPLTVGGGVVTTAAALTAGGLVKAVCLSPVEEPLDIVVITFQCFCKKIGRAFHH
jgi:hypothetical protein